MRPDKPFRLAVGSFKEDTHNQVEIIQCEQLAVAVWSVWHLAVWFGQLELLSVWVLVFAIALAHHTPWPSQHALLATAVIAMVLQQQLTHAVVYGMAWHGMVLYCTVL